MDKHDIAVIIKVAENYDRGRMTTLREAMQEAVISSLGSIQYRLGTHPHGTTKRFREGSPISEGWLATVPTGKIGGHEPRTGCLTIGPKFGGLLRNRATGAVTLLRRIE